jgi:2-polyprenyl-3-methyl-5-hydroxy-6-metoxy-1,4-benzoquinol methylase
VKLSEALAPARIRGVELLDDPATPDDVRQRAMADVAKSNTLFGGRSAVTAAVRRLIPQLPSVVTVLDVGTGHGEIAASVRALLIAAGKKTEVIGLDIAVAVARGARGALDGVAAGNALTLPLRARCVDLVLCSQLLHHFGSAEVRNVIGELNRVSRGWVVIADLRRSRLAAAGFWLASRALGFHPVTRHDGVVSVFRGFTAAELDEHVRAATGAQPELHSSLFWRVSATWRSTTA